MRPSDNINTPFYSRISPQNTHLRASRSSLFQCGHEYDKRYAKKHSRTELTNTTDREKLKKQKK